MAYLLGTDEAGYAPNLGPLVISATVWEVPDGVGGEDLFDRLSQVITNKPGRVNGAGSPRLAIADSKELYSSSKGIRQLERGVWAALGLLDHRPRCWRDVWHAIAPDALDPMQVIPWYAGYDGPVPLECDTAELDALVEVLLLGLADAGVRLVALRSRVIFAEEYNDLVDQYGSKGEALSRQTLALAMRLIESLPPGPVSVICDKHGGRNCYGALLAPHFPEWIVEVRGEGRQRSDYQVGPPDRRVKFCFRMQAESCMPAALASMASKYLRELAMGALNQYWQARVPALQPTAGYPQDAKRFLADIAQTQKRLGIGDRVLWRNR